MIVDTNGPFEASARFGVKIRQSSPNPRLKALTPLHILIPFKHKIFGAAVAAILFYLFIYLRLSPAIRNRMMPQPAVSWGNRHPSSRLCCCLNCPNELFRFSNCRFSSRELPLLNVRSEKSLTPKMERRELRAPAHMSSLSNF